MSLQDTLDQMKADFEAEAPPEALEIMHRATRELQESDAMDHALKTGEQAPDFSLTDHMGREVASKALLARGAMVISFYRGVW